MVPEHWSGRDPAEIVDVPCGRQVPEEHGSHEQQHAEDGKPPGSVPLPEI